MKSNCILFLLCLAASAASAEGAAKHPVTHEDVWLMKRVGAPALSPDGRLVVVAVAEPAYDDIAKASDLWLVPADGSAPPRRLTFSTGTESNPAWSPDSRRLAFTAKRDGQDEPQVYVLDIAGGGEAERVTKISTGASRPLWRPDGQAILFSSMTFPGAMNEVDNRKQLEERKARKYNARVFDQFPIRHWDRWLDERRPTLMLQVLGDASEAHDLLAGSALRNARGYGGDLDNDGDQLQATWSPDGSTIVFAATIARDQSARADVQTALYAMPAAGGEPRKITGDEASYSQPQFAADGSALYARSTPQTKFVYNDERLVRFDWADPSPRPVAFGFKRSVGSFQVSPDGETIYLVAEDQGHDRVFSLPSAGGEARELGRLESGSLSGLQVEGAEEAPVIVANWGSAVSPPEVMRIEPADGARSAITAFNAERVAAIDWAPIQEFWFESKRGRRIHNMIALPPGFDPARKYPLFVLIHGGPHTMYKDEFFIRWNYHLLAAPGYVVLMTNYTGSTGFGESFAQAIQGDPLAGPVRRDQPGCRRGDPPLSVHRRKPPGRGRRELRWPPDQLACGVDRALSRAREPRGPLRPEDAVDYERHRLFTRAQPRRPALAGQRCLEGPERVLALEETEDADPRDFRRARLPRSVQQRPRILDRAAKAAGREPAGDLPGREPLDTEGREQPLLLQGSPGLASPALRVAKRARGDCPL